MSKRLRRTLAMVLLLSIVPALHAESYDATLVGGGGIDDLSIVVRTADGRKITAYCNDHCGDSERLFVADRDESYSLRKEFRDRPVRVTVARQRNRDRFAGPASDDMVTVVTRFELLGK